MREDVALHGTRLSREDLLSIVHKLKKEDSKKHVC
jgi:hypothetical protein